MTKATGMSLGALRQRATGRNYRKSTNDPRVICIPALFQCSFKIPDISNGDTLEHNRS